MKKSISLIVIIAAMTLVNISTLNLDSLYYTNSQNQVMGELIYSQFLNVF